MAPVVDAYDVWLVEVGSGLGFASKSLDERWIGRIFGEQHLYGDWSIEELVASKEHFRHATARDAPVKLVAASENGPVGIAHCREPLVDASGTGAAC